MTVDPRAERKALRRIKWRGFWRGFFDPFGVREPITLDELRQRFYEDVRRFERDGS